MHTGMDTRSIIGQQQVHPSQVMHKGMDTRSIIE
jgi:hypothetical protein